MDEQYTGGDILIALESAERYNAYLTSLIRRAAGPTRAVIDFGAGLGTFAKRLKAEGYTVTCVEPDQAQRESLLAQGFETLESLDNVADGSAPFVFSLNVLEHIEHDARTAAQIYQKLQPGGAMLIYVPAFNCLWSSLDDQVHHYRRYTRRSLTRLVEDAGFTPIEIRYGDSLGFLAALAFRLLRRGADKLTPSAIAFYDRWVFPPSRVLDRLFDTVWGKNVYAICRKAPSPAAR
jgi:SAM-dependent methyltransferase